MHAVFDVKTDAGYDDDLTRHYWFDIRYWPEAEHAVDDWIIYREPRRGGGREGYSATAHIDRIEQDPTDPGLACAIMSGYLPFDSVVPLRRGFGFGEEKPEAIAPPSRLGAALQGRSISAISNMEFATIARAGLDMTLLPANAMRLALDHESIDKDVAVLLTAPADEQERQIVALLTNKRIRQASFRRAVLDAYDNRCAFTGIQLVDGGKVEAQASHILPVAQNGPDVVQNGIALTCTIHWMFDRHFIAVNPDYTLRVSRHRVPSAVYALLKQRNFRINLPTDPYLWPHASYVEQHRNGWMG